MNRINTKFITGTAARGIPKIKAATQTEINSALYGIIIKLKLVGLLSEESATKLHFLLKELEMENEDEVMELIAEKVDKYLDFKNRDEIINDKSYMMENLAIVFPDKVSEFKRLVKESLINELNTKAKVNATELIRGVYFSKNSSEVDMSNSELKGWKALIEKAKDIETIENIVDCVISKFSRFDANDFRRKAPKVFEVISQHYPEVFNQIKAR